MALRANITLTDATPVTPVNRIYLPTNDPTVIKWIDRTQGIAAGQNSLTLEQRVSSKNTPTYKMTWKLTCPILAVTAPTTSTGIQPAPSVAYSNIASLQLVLHERATQQERKDMLSQLRDLIDEAIVTNQVENLDLVW